MAERFSDPEAFANAMLAEFDAYEEEVYTQVKKGIDKTAKAMKEEIRNSGEFVDRTGDYRKAFAFRKEENFNRRKYTKTWYVKAPHYRLTHLLEKGHLTRKGRRTRAFPHISKGEEYAQKNLIKNIEEEIGRGS